MSWHRLRRLIASFGRRNSSASVGVAPSDPCPDEWNDHETSDAMSDGTPWELLVRYGVGELTSEELATLASWKDQRPEHVRALRSTARLAALSQTADSVRHADAGWQRLQRRLERESANGSRAPLVIPVHRGRPAASMPVPASRPRWVKWSIGIAAAAAVAAGVVVRQRSAAPPAVLQEIATHRGERLEFGLPDGSHVVLGAESRLRFGADGFASARTLYLSGQGYFAVAHDTKHPFVVHARGAAVQAVGTAFGVRAYDEDSSVSVAVAQGRILFRRDASAEGTGDSVGLGDIAELNGAGRMTVHREADLDASLGWVRGRLIYHMAPATDVARDLERWYDVSIQIDDTAQSRLGVTMTIDPSQPAPVSLQRFAEVLNLHVLQTGQQVHLTRASAADSP